MPVLINIRSLNIFGLIRSQRSLFDDRAEGSLQRRISRYNVAVMSEHEKKDGNKKIFELSEREKSGALYIMGVVILIFSIVFLATLTHLVLHT